jgi:ABC-type spermidine/putrescine transport system permease subunit II
MEILSDFRWACQRVQLEDFMTVFSRIACIAGAAPLLGAGLIRTYASIVLPMMRPAFLSIFIILAHLAIKSFDLVVALTGGGPG